MAMGSAREQHTAQSDNSELRHRTSAGREFIGNLGLSPDAAGRQWRAGAQSVSLLRVSINDQHQHQAPLSIGIDRSPHSPIL